MDLTVSDREGLLQLMFGRRQTGVRRRDAEGAEFTQRIYSTLRAPLYAGTAPAAVNDSLNTLKGNKQPFHS